MMNGIAHQEMPTKARVVPSVGNPAASPGWKRRVKNLGKRGLRGMFEIGQRFGFDLLPRHFYSEIPDIRVLRRESGWKSAHSMVGVEGSDPNGQFAFVESCCPVELVDALKTQDVFGAACSANGEPGFSPIDADFLYAFIRTVRPAKVVQVGCGVSTAVVLHAAADEGYQPEVVCVEPYPTGFLKKLDRSEQIRLIEEKAQAVALETLTNLGDGGFLFVDSTHAVMPGSEVNRMILEVLPRLEKNSYVHFHDIYFPYNYQRGLLDDELFFSNESTLLHAFLINNPSFAILASLSMLHHDDPQRLGQSLPNYRPAGNDHGLRTGAGHFPASIYLRAGDFR